MDYKAIRKELGMSQIKMAQALSVHINTWINWERGVSKPTEENQEKIDNLLKELRK